MCTIEKPAARISWELPLNSNYPVTYNIFYDTYDIIALICDKTVANGAKLCDNHAKGYKARRKDVPRGGAKDARMPLCAFRITFRDYFSCSGSSKQIVK